MKNVDYLPSSLNAVEHLRVDVDAMNIKFFTLPEAPTGIFNPKYAEKCYTFAAGVSGDGEVDYLVFMALRPDWATSGDAKVLDIDTAAFCFKADDLKAAPSGVALFHQNFDGRTTPLTGYEAFTLEETVNDLHSKLIPGSVPLSAASAGCVSAMAHSIMKFNELLNPQIAEWKVSFSGPEAVEWSNVQLFENSEVRIEGRTTGKLDVREAAIKLPEVAAAPVAEIETGEIEA